MGGGVGVTFVRTVVFSVAFIVTLSVQLKYNAVTVLLIKVLFSVAESTNTSISIVCVLPFVMFKIQTLFPRVGTMLAELNVTFGEYVSVMFTSVAFPVPTLVIVIVLILLLLLISMILVGGVSVLIILCGILVLVLLMIVFWICLLRMVQEIWFLI